MSAFDERMAALKLRFRDRAATDRERIRAALDAGDRGSLQTICHGLAGIAGIFGEPALGDVAEQVELAAERRAPEAELAPLCADLLERLDAID